MFVILDSFIDRTQKLNTRNRLAGLSLARYNGTAVTIQGPSFSICCAVVKMTTVPEVELAKKIRISYALIALIRLQGENLDREGCGEYW